MDLADLVATTAAVAATRSRSEKIDALASLLARAQASEVAVIVGLVSGSPRQGRIGVGWATVADAEATPAISSTLSVRDLDDLLSTIGSTHGVGSHDERRDALVRFLDRATAAEGDFVRRLLVGELRQGANAGIVAEAVARAADVPIGAFRRAVMLTGDLGVAAAIAAGEGRAGIEAVGLEVFRPIQPMLAATAARAGEAVEQLGRSSVEWKLDGIRIQAHRIGDSVRIWTRNLNEITDEVPEVVEVVRAIAAESLVLDGEILGVDDAGAPLTFQETATVGTTVTPYFFDLLYHDGLDLLGEPLEHRRARLVRAVGSSAVPGTITDDPERADSVFEEAIEAGHEGVVVKAADSPYQAGRRGKAWRKVKPVHTLDLVVLAVEYGSGRRRGWLSNIHLGARDPADGSFVMVGKTFKGMTDEMLRWQTERFRELAVEDDGHVVTVRPEQVVEIALDGVQTSRRYPGGVALRFARVVRYRTDKPPSEADTIDAVRSLD